MRLRLFTSDVDLATRSRELKEFVSTRRPFVHRGWDEVWLETAPTISVIIPSYSQGRFIEETILSVKSQDYPNTEHIVLDRQSRDNSDEDNTF